MMTLRVKALTTMLDDLEFNLQDQMERKPNPKSEVTLSSDLHAHFHINK